MAIKDNNMDMCSGPLFSKILIFALPIMAMNILQLLFNTADMVVVGRWLLRHAGLTCACSRLSPCWRFMCGCMWAWEWCYSAIEVYTILWNLLRWPWVQCGEIAGEGSPPPPKNHFRVGATFCSKRVLITPQAFILVALLPCICAI